MRLLTLSGRNLLLILALVLLPATAGAATIIVDWTGAGDYLTIQEGIDAAVSGDTVYVRAGTYTPPPYTDINFQGKAIVVRSVSGPENTVIAGDLHNEIRFESGEVRQSVLRGFSIDNCPMVINGNSSPIIGDNTFLRGGIGSIYSTSGSPWIVGNRFYDGTDVAALRLSFGMSSITETVVENNLFIGDGTGIGISYSQHMPDASIVIRDNVITGFETGIKTSNNGGTDTGPIIENNLLYGNTLAMEMRSGTLTGNTIAFNHGPGRCSGVYSSTGAELLIRDCILWQNSSYYGAQIYFLSGTGDVDVAHTLIQGGQEGIHGTNNLVWGAGNLDQDPLLLDGPAGPCYLSQTAAGQAVDSPCLDAGSQPAVVGDGTTRTDQADDTGTLDIGYHHQEIPGLFICHHLPENLIYAMEGGGNPVVPPLGIWQGGEGILHWTVADDVGWLEFSPASGTSTGEVDEVQLLVEVAGLPPGDHHAVITITAPAAVNSPVTIPLTLTINRTWVVDQAGGGDVTTIQEGLDAATDHDVVLVRPGTYAGDGNRDLDFAGKELTLVSEQGPALTIIDAGGGFDEHHRGFNFQGQEGPDAIVRGFTIRGGFAEEGGGIHCGYTCSPTVRGNHIIGNRAQGNGGGIYLDSYSQSLIEDNLIADNHVLGGAPSYHGGGGICADCQPAIRNNRVIGNTSITSGGGIYCYLPPEGLVNNLIAGNSADHYGGGLWFRNQAGAEIRNCTFVGNHADEGGGFYTPNWNDPTTLSNCILWDNQALNEGDQGFTRPPMTVQYCDVQDGEAGITAVSKLTWGDGNIDADPEFAALCDFEYLLSQTAAGQPADSPCVDAGDPATPAMDRTTRTDFIADAGTVDMGFHHQVLTEPRLLVSHDALDFRAVAGGEGPEPEEIRLANGGPYPMGWTAQASDDWLQLDVTSGSCQSGETVSVTVSVTITGMSRGAYQAEIHIEAPGASGSPRVIPVHLYLGGTFSVIQGGSGDYDTLQDALDNAVHGDTILVSPGTYSGPDNRDLDFGGVDVSLVSIDGPEQTIIDCQGDGRAFHFQGSESRSATVSGFTITGGSAEYGGGAMLLSGAASPTVTDCIFVTNRAQTSGGAAECRHDSSPLFLRNTFRENEAIEQGGGMNVIDLSSPELVENAFESNTAVEFGGGLRVNSDSPVIIHGNRFEGNSCTDLWNSSLGGGACVVRQTLEDNIFTGNTAHHGGGLWGSHCELTNNLLAGNHALQKGGGAFLEYGGVVRSTTIAGNSSGTRGGGLFLARTGTCQIDNSILWGNQALYDHEICLGFPEDTPVTIEYSDIQTSGDWISDGVALTWGAGNLETDPIFVDGQLGSHLLSQQDAGQSVTSPCVNAGDAMSEMIDGTTRTDGVPDAGILDMGFHHPAGAPKPPDTALITGPGPAPGNPPLVRIFPPEQDAVHEYEFPVYGADQNGVNVAAGDVNDNGLDAVLTGAGPGEIYGPHVRGFQVDGTPLPGLSFLAYGTNRFGVNVAAGDLDGDGYDEIITGAGPGAVFGPHVRAFDYDGTPGVSAFPGVSYFAYGTPKWGANVCCGDIDGDGYDEIVTGPGPGAVYGPHVRGWNVDGGSAAAIPAVSFMAYGTFKYGVNVTCGDVDGDGMAEIVTGPGPGAVFGTHIRGWNFDGQTLTELPGLNFFAWAHTYAAFGAEVSAGTDLDGDGRDELLVGCGPDPDVGTPVKVYDYDGTQVTQWFSLEAFAGLTHGTTVAAGRY